MAIHSIEKFDQCIKVLLSSANRDWDDATAGNIMWCLVGAGYTKDLTDTTTADLGANIITSGDGAPINATGLSLDDTSTPGTVKFKSDNANFGASVTITAKFLVAVMPVTAGTFSATTSKLLLIDDLNTASSSSVVTSSGDEFVVNMPVTAPADGWGKIG
jgi:hypothetical protein